MSNAKDKAEELLRQFSFVEFDQKNGVRLVNPTLKHAAKQCALIAVEEILDVLVCLPQSVYTKKIDEAADYWQDVKTEIENL